MTHIKNFLRSHFPQAFTLGRNVFNVLFVAIKWQYLTRSGDEAKYFRTCKTGQGQLLNLWGGINSIENPLRLNFLEITKLAPSILLNYKHFNPTIRVNGKTLKLMWRVSDYTMPMDYDKKGNPRIGHTSRSKNEDDFEGIISAELPIPFQKILDTPINQKLLQESLISNLDESLAKLQLPVCKVFVEDPRMHQGEDSIITAIARFGNLRPGNTIRNHTRMIIINSKTNVGTIVHSDNDNLIEKNWVVIKHIERDLIMLKRSNPQEIIYVDTMTGLTKSLPCNVLIKKKNCANLNGGSGFVLIDDLYYLRVARIQFPLAKLGLTRINVIVKHDLNFLEISRSKPFVFQSLGVEICNGFAYNENYFFFSWGQDDRSMYVGSCRKSDLLNWYSNNLQN